MKTKVIIALIALFGCTAKTFASDPLVVDKLIHKTTDLSASNAPKDMNGNSCGLLKVITNDKSMTFEGSVVGTPEYKNGEYWVYIPQGVYQIKLKSDKNDPLLLSFKDYNIEKVTPKSTYELTFHVRDYDWLRMKDYTIIQGPTLKKYAMVVMTLPGTGWTVGGMSTLDYLKRMANVISKDGDGWGDKHVCTILGEKEDSNYRTYKLVIESTDDEFDAILGAAAAYGCFAPTIYQVER
ncbi:MAG: hypothetical protein NC453_21310 [Muribaculum sp.]|nr:hypothetical protein [Muribaculum sp.]